MKPVRPLVAVLLAIAAVTIIAYPSTTTAITLTHHFVVPHGVTGHGEQHRVAVRTVAPSDSDLDGVPDSADKCPQTAGESAYDGCKPPASDPVATTPPASYAPSPTPSTTTVPTSSGGCPSYMAAEASSPSAVNASSGAAGCYQVLPSTQAAMGSACSDVNASSCVAAICAAEGNGAWASSGATPCDYVRP